VKVHLNGILQEADAARIDPADRGLTLGDGLFETLQAKDGRVLRLEAHLDRLARGAEVIGLPLPDMDLEAALADTLAANGLSDGVLRLTLTRGVGPRGVLPPLAPQPTVLITAAPLPPPAPAACLIGASVTRRNELSPLAAIKSLNYLDNILARQEAARRGADDAVLLNTMERVAETSIANIFAVLDGRLITPPVSEGALPGVMRAAVLALEGIERAFTLQELMQADEVFLTSALSIRPVREVEGFVLLSDAAARRLAAALAVG